MKKVLIMFFLALFSLTGCFEDGEDGGNDNKIDPEAAQEKVTLANSSMENEMNVMSNIDINRPSDLDQINFTVSNSLYKEAVALDPNNLDAQLGAAVTEIMTLIQNDQFKVLRDYWENEPSLRDSENLKNRFNSILPFVNNNLLPAIDYAIERLEVLEDNSDYTYTITSKMMGGSSDPYNYEYMEPKELDLTEIKLAHAYLVAMKGFINILNSYNLELTSYTASSIETALNKGGSFLTLKDGSKMGDALENFKAAIDIALEGIDFLLAETDSQVDDIIKNDDRDEINNIREKLVDIKSALNNPFTLLFGNNSELVIDLVAFMTNPPQDLKELLPDYTITVSAEYNEMDLDYDSEIEFTLPDYTIGSLFPNNTTKDSWKNFLNSVLCDDEFDLVCYQYCNSYDYQFCNFEYDDYCSCDNMPYYIDEGSCYCDDYGCNGTESYCYEDGDDFCLDSDIAENYCE